ncbi:DUF2515 family protein [Pseudalkalibacillus hwajinpoensis]|uniref:DUF2515 family protein n=1 Tax=Guptibacillus hwajinpoensis TaxID=208199 RepID=UPI00325AA84F
MNVFKSLFHLSQHTNLSSSLLKDLKKVSKTTKPSPPLSLYDQRFVSMIREKTALHNRNNVTRTKAYLDFFKFNPDIHWAFLAHLVSRNAGWTMTDLKGEYLPHLLTPEQQQSFFSFLERGNWLIFQDAYPQLLLYKESVLRKRPLFHLLPSLHVSSFMKVIWEDFWQNKNSEVLTASLIINEQHYIESRVIQTDHFKKSVFQTLAFQLQDVLNTNTLLFPMIEGDTVTLTGEAAHHFLYVKERIELGKRLYTRLFSNERNLNAIINWATLHPHTGSRKDYWSHLFNSVKEGKPLEKRIIKDCLLQKGPRIYSPSLTAWSDVTHKSPDRSDWYTNSNIIDLLNLPSPDLSGNVQKIHCHSLTLLEKINGFPT